MRRDFSGENFDLAAGEVYGLRVWRQDDYGRLRALHLDMAAPWRPGINIATCHAGTYGVTAAIRGVQMHFAVGRALGGGVGGFAPAPGIEQARWTEPPIHDAPGEDCDCGFYAYTQPTRETFLDEHGKVLGVIRGTGRTLIGTKGFRCEKAEIVALLAPAGAGTWSDWQQDRLRAVYPGVPVVGSRAELLEFAPLETTTPDPSSDEFWALP